MEEERDEHPETLPIIRTVVLVLVERDEEPAAPEGETLN